MIRRLTTAIALGGLLLGATPVDVAAQQAPKSDAKNPCAAKSTDVKDPRAGRTRAEAAKPAEPSAIPTFARAPTLDSFQAP